MDCLLSFFCSNEENFHQKDQKKYAFFAKSGIPILIIFGIATTLECIFGLFESQIQKNLYFEKFYLPKSVDVSFKNFREFSRIVQEFLRIFQEFFKNFENFPSNFPSNFLRNFQGF